MAISPTKVRPFFARQNVGRNVSFAGRVQYLPPGVEIRDIRASGGDRQFQAVYNGVEGKRFTIGQGGLDLQNLLRSVGAPTGQPVILGEPVETVRGPASGIPSTTIIRRPSGETVVQRRDARGRITTTRTESQKQRSARVRAERAAEEEAAKKRLTNAEARQLAQQTFRRIEKVSGQPRGTVTRIQRMKDGTITAFSSTGNKVVYDKGFRAKRYITPRGKVIDVTGMTQKQILTKLEKTFPGRIKTVDQATIEKATKLAEQVRESTLKKLFKKVGIKVVPDAEQLRNIKLLQKTGWKVKVDEGGVLRATKKGKKTVILSRSGERPKKDNYAIALRKEIMQRMKENNNLPLKQRVAGDIKLQLEWIDRLTKETSVRAKPIMKNVRATAAHYGRVLKGMPLRVVELTTDKAFATGNYRRAVQNLYKKQKLGRVTDQDVRRVNEAWEFVLKTNKQHFATENMIKEVGVGVTEFVVQVAKGAFDLAKVGWITTRDVPKLKSLANAYIAHYTIKGVFTARNKLRRSTSVQTKKVADSKKVLEAKKKVLKNKFAKNKKEAAKLLKKDNTKLAVAVIALIGLGVAGAAAGGAAAAGSISIGAKAGAVFAKGTALTLKGVGIFATGAQGLQTLRKPTPRNFGRLLFFMAPTALALWRTGQKVANPNFIPSKKGFTEMRAYAKAKRQDAARQIAKIKKEIPKLNSFQRARANRAIKRLERGRKFADNAYKQANKVINKMTKDRDYKAMDEYVLLNVFNQQVHNRLYQKITKEVKTGFHQSTTNDPRLVTANLYREFKIKPETISKAFKGLTKKPLRPLKFNTKYQRALASLNKSRQWTNWGSKTLNTYVSKIRQRRTGDMDVLVSQPRKEAAAALLFLRKKFPKTKFSLKKGQKSWHIETDGKKIIDFGKLPKRGVATLQNKGFKAVTPETLLKAKFNPNNPFGKFVPSLETTRGQARGWKDILDIVRLSRGKVRRGQLVQFKRSPKNTVTVDSGVKGMGADRMKFDERFLYVDNQVAIGYAPRGGKPGTIWKIDIPNGVSKFPQALQRRSWLAAQGRLNLRQSAKLRADIGRWLMNNPKTYKLGKFFKEPRTSSLIIGEQQWGAIDGSRYIKRDVYKTWNPDLKEFVSIIHFGFTKQKRIPLFKKFWDAYKGNPFRRLKDRLTNTDITKVKKFGKLIMREKFEANSRKAFLNIFKNMFKKKPKTIQQFEFLVESRSKQAIKLANQLVAAKKAGKSVKQLAKINTKLNKVLKLLPVRNRRLVKAEISTKTFKAAVRAARPVKVKRRVRVKKKRVVKKKVKKKKPTRESDRRKLKELTEKLTRARKAQRKAILRAEIRRIRKRLRVVVRKKTRVRPRKRTRKAPRTRVRPTTRTRPRPRVVTRPRDRPRPRERTRPRPRPRPRTRPRPRPRPRTRPRPRARPRTRKRTRTPPPPPPPPPFLRDKERRVAKKKIAKVLKTQKFIYLPDVAAILYGQKATAAQKKLLLRKGRKFTGLEARLLTK